MRIRAHVVLLFFSAGIFCEVGQATQFLGAKLRNASEQYTTSFLTTDKVAIVELLFRDPTVGDTVGRKWIAPDGSIPAFSSITTTVRSDRYWMVWFELPIAGGVGARSPGMWKVEGYLNGTLVVTLDFMIVEPGGVVYLGPTPTSATVESTVNIQVMVSNPWSTPINNVWLGLDVASADGKTIDSTKLPSNPGGRIDFGATQGQNLPGLGSLTFNASFTFDASRYQAGSYKYRFWGWKNGSPGGGGTPITSLWERAVTLAPSPCPGPEPALTVMLTPGFYVAATRLQPLGTEGYFEMSVAPGKDQQAGGFILGGGIQEKGATPFFAAFSIPALQQVTVQLNPRVLPGGDPKQFSACARLLNSQRQQIGTERCSAGYIEFRQVLPPDFYIVEVRTGAASPRAYFEMSLSESQFAPSLIAGGFAAQEVGSFVAFSIAEPQEVQIRTAGQKAFGWFGANCLRLTLFDAAHNVIRTVP